MIYDLTKKIFKFSTVILIFIIISFIFLYFSIPSKIILYEGTKAEINTFLPFSKTKDCISTDTQPFVKANKNLININAIQTGSFDYELKLLDKIPFKTINVSVIPKNYVIPGGETIGVKLYTEGLLVVYVSEVTGKDLRQYTPAKDANIKKCDRILAVDSKKISSNEEFMQYLNEKKSTVTITLARGEEIITTQLTPVISAADSKYKAGLWVRDSTAGIGTLTYYNPTDNSFAALGHAICDADTMSMLKLADGKLTQCSVVSITKGEKGEPGELKGSLSNQNIGKILKNDEFGIYGKINKNYQIYKTPMAVASRFEVKEGEAYILCDVDGQGVRQYSVDLSKISKTEKPDNKSMVVTVTDEKLLNLTGGIVQGMSGSPIIQNGKLVGAVTHVFVNDPTRGYGIFIENMLADKIE